MLIKLETTAYEESHQARYFNVKQETGGRHPVTGKIILIFNCMLHMYFFSQHKLTKEIYKVQILAMQFSTLLPLLQLRQHIKSPLVQEIISPDHDPVENAFQIV